MSTTDPEPTVELTPEGEQKLRVKQKLSTSMKRRSKLMQHTDTAAPEPAPAPAAPSSAPAPASPPAAEQPLLRNKRLKRTGHFELRPNQFVSQEPEPPEETEY